MTRVGRRLIEDFLLPALNEQRYGDLLKWIDREKYHFSIRWSHKNAAKWTLQDTAVFQDWDKLKGHYHPEIKGYYMQAKQRFRAALYKLNTVKKLPCEDKHVKKYQLVLDDKKNGIHCMSKPRIKKLAPKIEEGQRSIPTSVICKNAAYVAKQSDSCEPLSPAISIKSEISESAEELVMSIESDEELEKKHIPEDKLVSQNVWDSHVEPLIKIEPPEESCSPVQRHIPHLNPGQRAPHVPIQPVPVYTKCSQQVLCVPQRRFESPHVLLVPIYSSSVSGSSIREKPEKYALSYGHSRKSTSDVALNLTVRPKPSSLAITNR